ncbi:Uncharacterised protein [Escherichia coli]|uniref:Uncharacterized protein n=1 Tax=Escherichia coli TaxID=562 RepID=A0A2X1N5K1_ECOLX|nr:Uncharacterised protein [Escherichia coli]
MKNNFPALLLGTALMITSPVTVYAQSPATLSFPQGGQFGSVSVIPIPI